MIGDKIKEMEYFDGTTFIELRQKKVSIELERNSYKGYEYIVLSLFSHPTAYVILDKNHKWFGKSEEEINISCHGGLTYSSNTLSDIITEEEDKWVIGWDYSHNILGDYSGMIIELGGKKWTTKEIIDEVIEFIDSMEESLENKE